LDRAVSF